MREHDIAPQTEQNLDRAFRVFHAISCPRSLDFCGLTDDDVADVARCLDNVGRRNIVML